MRIWLLSSKEFTFFSPYGDIRSMYIFASLIFPFLVIFWGGGKKVYKRRQKFTWPEEPTRVISVFVIFFLSFATIAWKVKVARTFTLHNVYIKEETYTLYEVKMSCVLKKNPLKNEIMVHCLTSKSFDLNV
jgi:hypothetical protein